MVVYTGTVRKWCRQEISASRAAATTNEHGIMPAGGRSAGIPSALDQRPTRLWLSRSLARRGHEARAAHDRGRWRVHGSRTLLSRLGKMRQLAHVDEARSQAHAPC